MDRTLLAYYAATVLFLILDYIFGLNIRIAFLDTWPVARVAYYGLCFGCLAVIIWRPAWALAVTTLETLATLIALILSMAIKVTIPGDPTIDEGVVAVTSEELVNFLISGSIAYHAWNRGLRELFGDKLR